MKELPCPAVLRWCLTSLSLALAALAVAPGAASAATCTADTPSLPLNTPIEITYACAVTGTPKVTNQWPGWGTVTILTGKGETPVRVRYTPNPDLRGVDRFSWSDGEGTIAEQYVVVGAPLQLSCEGVTRLGQTPAPIVARDGQDQEILIRCNQIPGDALDIELTSPPAHGTVTVVDDSIGPGVLRYRSTPGYTGPDSVSIRVKSPVPGRTSPSFSIPITVKGPNRAPVCPPVPLTIVTVGTVKHFPNLCSDPDGDPLSYGLVVAPPRADAFFGPDLVLNYRPRPGWTGPDTIRVVVGDGFSTSGVDIPVEVRDAEAPPSSPPPPAAPPPVAPPPPASLPAPPDGFVPARGVDVGADAAVWGPVGGIRLGRRALPVIAAGCRVACTVSAQLRLYPNGRRPVALPPQRLQLAGGRREVVRMKLTGAARTALRGRKRVKAVLALAVQPDSGAPVRDTLDLRVGLPSTKRGR